MWHWFSNLILSLILLQSNGNVLVNNDFKIIKLNPAAPEFTLSADKGAVLSVNDRVFFYSKNSDLVQPIASISKLMTALVFLENNPGWETNYTITDKDSVEGGRLNLFIGEELKIKDIFKTSLIASDNGATLALVHSSGLSEDDFIKKMNEKAFALGLKKTSFVDTVGLSDNNISSAKEVALLAKEALSKKEIREATETKEYNFKTLNGREKKIESTDNLLFDSEKNNFSVLGGKTGYTDKAGYCFVGRFKDGNGREIISVVLNSSGKNERFKESKSLVNWVFNNYDWRP
ncbi:MAG: D-alanyl-D-alanine carboxypeptidase family protein [Patescibacteria group bacterium]